MGKTRLREANAELSEAGTSIRDETPPTSIASNSAYMLPLWQSSAPAGGPSSRQTRAHTTHSRGSYEEHRPLDIRSQTDRRPTNELSSPFSWSKRSDGFPGRQTERNGRVKKTRSGRARTTYATRPEDDFESRSSNDVTSLHSYRNGRLSNGSNASRSSAFSPAHWNGSMYVHT